MPNNLFGYGAFLIIGKCEDPPLVRFKPAPNSTLLIYCRLCEFGIGSVESFHPPTQSGTEALDRLNCRDSLREKIDQPPNTLLHLTPLGALTSIGHNVMEPSDSGGTNKSYPAYMRTDNEHVLLVRF
jgi:hypothetical protein